MGLLTSEERLYVRDLIHRGVLRKFNKNDFLGITKNGGVGVFCGDGDIDVFNYHQQTITSRPHSVKFFGGVLIFAQNFPGFNEQFALGAAVNMEWGMEGKNTRSIFLYPHYPCAVASKFKIPIEYVIALSAEAHRACQGYPPFAKEHVHSFFHVKRLNKGDEVEQNTYLFYPELL